VWGPDPAQGVFEGQLFLHPDLRFSVRFPDGWRTANTASAVGAFRDREAEVVVGVAGSHTSPAAEGVKVSKALRREDLVPDDEERVVVHGNPGYFLHVTHRGLDVSILWVAIRRLTYMAVGLGPTSDRPAIMASLYSMRDITDEEREAIEVIRMHPAEARAGETLVELGDRTENAWTPAYTAMVNGIREDAILESGAVVKIARRERYVSAPSFGLR
ncbi:MAG TPA: hypothetical protein VFF73_04770, partial [Planctomycetota bacterium]|nr:hypothetical protein [Planctomycetota bacterium]